MSCVLRSSLVSFWCTNIGSVINTNDDTCCCYPSFISYSIVIPKKLEETVNATIDDVSFEYMYINSEEVKVKYYINIFCPKLVNSCSKAVLTCPDIQDYYYNANNDYCCCVQNIIPNLKLRNSSNVVNESKKIINRAAHRHLGTRAS